MEKMLPITTQGLKTKKKIKLSFICYCNQFYLQSASIYSKYDNIN